MQCLRLRPLRRNVQPCGYFQSVSLSTGSNHVMLNVLHLKWRGALLESVYACIQRRCYG